MEENHCINSDTSSNRGGRPDPSSISDEVWEIAEEATWQEVISCVQPTLDTEEKRKDVIEYVQRIIRSSIGVEVFPYGSVPLKTYLPDGDIDLTALSYPKSDDTLSRDVFAVIHAEQLNENAEYEVRDAQYIDAEVKLVKCLIHNLIIDISFNQLGGLSTLCFLEQVDRLIGKDHLFKHSIILIKAWCYYESRILGAHHGLISTYALESLILYIFHLFNSSLNGPLAVLYRFLVYFSKFDWENYGISLNGPICLSSLPDIVVGNPENEDVMLSEEFLRNCVDMFSLSSRSHETNLRVFAKKHINIIDPLKENNNLGRSVNKGNYFRIRSAFKFGARKLGNILSLPRDRIADELKSFFENTLERHGRKYVSRISDGELGRVPSSLHFGEDMHLNQSNGNNGDHILLCVEDKIRSGSRTEPDREFSVSSQGVLQTCYSPEGTVSSVGRSSARFSDSVISSPDDTISDSLSVDYREKSLDSIVGDIECSNLSDLSGDYDSHIRSLLYGQCCHGYALSSSVLSSPRSLSPSQFQNMPWDTVRQYLPLIWQMNSDGAAVGQSPYTVDNTNLSIAGIGLAERRKARGTGTYIPNRDRNSFRERPSQGRRNQGQETNWQLQKYTLNNVVDSTSPRTLDTTLPQSNLFVEGDHKIMKEESSVFDCEKHESNRRVHTKSVNTHGNGISTSNRKLESDSTLLRTGSFQGAPKLMKEQPSVFNGEKQDPQRQLVRANSVNSNGNGVPISYRKLEFGSFGSFTEGNSQLGLGNSTSGEFTSSPTAQAVQNSKEVKGRIQDRVQEKSLNLENDDDFPPLTS